MTKVIQLPDAEFSGQNLDESPHLYAHDDAYHVYEWTPERDGQGAPTEVHLVVEFGGAKPFALCIALRSADAVDAMVGALMRHRNAVFGASSS